MLDADTSLREKIGVVYDGDNFPAYWTAKQLSKVMEGLYTQWDNSLFQKYLEDFHLPAKQKIKHYSRGMTMKLAIAAALAHHPELLILDEATSALDNDTEAAIMESINSLHGHKTLIIIAHRLQTIEKCDIVYRVEHGEIERER